MKPCEGKVPRGKWLVPCALAAGHAGDCAPRQTGDGWFFDKDKALRGHDHSKCPHPDCGGKP